MVHLRLESKQEEKVGPQISEVDYRNVGDPDWERMFVDAIFSHLCIAQDVVYESLLVLVSVSFDKHGRGAAPSEDPQEDEQEEQQVLVVTQ